MPGIRQEVVEQRRLADPARRAVPEYCVSEFRILEPVPAQSVAPLQVRLEALGREVVTQAADELPEVEIRRERDDSGNILDDHRRAQRAVRMADAAFAHKLSAQVQVDAGEPLH